MNKLWSFTVGSEPVIATAIHNGHKVRNEVEKNFAISESNRLREEDPFTGKWTDIADTQVIVELSRFQVDLNRPKEKAVYIKPEDAWGLHIWKQDPTKELIDRSLEEYDRFYKELYNLLAKLEKKFGKIVVLDLHTYNHRREGPDGPLANVNENPEINIGTGTMDRQRWATVVDRFIEDLKNYDFLGRNLDVRENIKFRGGQLSRWIHQNFPMTVCALAVEVKKFFMDEWTGVLDESLFGAVHKTLKSSVPGIKDELNKMSK